MGGGCGVKELQWRHLWGPGGRYEAGGPIFGVLGVQIWGEMSHVWGAQKALMGLKELPVGSWGGRCGVKGTAVGALMGSWGEI